MNQVITVNIPAAVGGIAGVFTLPAKYKIFSCISTNGTYTAQPGLNAVPYVVDSAGRGFGGAGDNAPVYSSCVFINNTAGVIQTQVYLGDTPLPQNFIANAITVTASVGVTTLASSTIRLTAPVGLAPVAFGAGTFFMASISAYKTAVRGANVGNIYIGATNTPNNQPYVMAPGDERSIISPANCQRRLNDWYLYADNAGDGAIITLC